MTQTNRGQTNRGWAMRSAVVAAWGLVGAVACADAGAGSEDVREDAGASDRVDSGDAGDGGEAADTTDAVEGDDGAEAILPPDPDPFPRALAAVPREGGAVYLSWRFVRADPEEVGFLVYRRLPGGAYGAPLNDGRPVVDSTNYLDETAVAGETYYYVVRAAIDGEPREPPSNEAVATAAEAARPGIRMVPEAGSPMATFDTGRRAVDRVGVADLDGDGTLDYVVRTYACHSPVAGEYWPQQDNVDGTTEYWAYAGDGTHLWTHVVGPHFDGHPWPLVTWDLDGDGRDEVVTVVPGREAGGRGEAGAYDVVVLDGTTGEEIRRAEFPAHVPPAGHVARNMLAIAYLDGTSPHVVFSQGTYYYDPTVIRAMDAELSLIWRTDREEIRAAGGDGDSAHRLSIGDLDGDGRDEILHGDNCLDDDGRLLWSMGEGHPDLAMIADIDADGELEAVFAGEAPWADEHPSGTWHDDPDNYHPRTALSVVLDGRPAADSIRPAAYWQRRDYCDLGFALLGDVSRDWEGWEILVADEEGGPLDIVGVGNELRTRYPPGAFWNYYHLVRWTGDELWQGVTGTYQLHHDRNLGVCNHGEGPFVTFPGDTAARLVGDVVGDFREEIITLSPDGRALDIYVNTEIIETREVTPLQDLLYREHMARALVGYGDGYKHRGGHPIPEPGATYRIAGTVRAEGTGVARVVLHLTGRAHDGSPVEAAAVSGSSGAYVFRGLPSHGTFAVAAERFGYEFVPVELAVVLAGASLDGQDFQARWTLPIESEPRLNVCSGRPYDIAPVGAGDAHYLDRTYTITSIPAAYRSHLWLRTAMDDKSCANDPLIVLRATETVEVAVGYPEGARPPAWLGAWSDTGQSVVADHAPYGETRLRLFARTFPPGDVRLGPCGVGADVMYVVLFD